MRLRIILTVILLLSSAAAAGNSYVLQSEPGEEMLNRIRNEFYKAVDDEDTLKGLLRYIESSYKTEPAEYPSVILSYYGALETLKAKHTHNPYSKFKNVISGLKKLDQAVNRANDKLEVRFLRFAVLHNIPGVFGVTDERNADLKVTYEQLLKQDYSSIERQLQKGIVEFLLKSERLDIIQTDRLKRIFPDAK